MKNYDVYFEIFGRKMKTTVFAASEIDAKQKVMNKIKWHRVTEKPEDEMNKILDFLEGIKDSIS